MPRPQRCRKVCNEPEYSTFFPAGVASGEPVILTVDEFEVIRLVDLEQLTHSQAAVRMEISRTTAAVAGIPLTRQLPLPSALISRYSKRSSPGS